MSERQKASKFRSELKKFHNGHIVVETHTDARNTGVKPYDSYVVRHGEFFAIEFKEAKGLSVTSKCLQPNQADSLMHVVNVGGSGVYAFVSVFFKRREISSKLFTCNIRRWLRLFEYENDGGVWKPKKTSIKVKELEERMPNNFVERKRLKKNGEKYFGWDFNQYFVTRFHV